MSYQTVEIANAQIFLVGGAVRDQLLGLSVKERDWVVIGSNTQQMLTLGYRQVGSDFPVFLHPETHEEYALARQERKLSEGHKGFQTLTANVSLEEDLSRRDITINAIAMSAGGQLIDPYKGQSDLDQRILRHVSGAFSEDPLRVLRIARFAAQLAPFNFQIAPETLKLLNKMSKTGELNSLTPERVWRETEKALKSKSPRTYFDTLGAVGALKIIFPEIDALFGIPQRPEFHPEIDSGLHTMLSLDRITESTEDPRLRFAVLTHDLGKATTPENVLPRHTGHEERSAQISELLCERLRIPNEYRRLAILVARHHLLCHRVLNLKPATIEQLLSNLGAWQERSLVSDFTECCKADARGRTGLESRHYPQAEFMNECGKIAKNISITELMEKGLSGKGLGDQLKIERSKQIRSILEDYADIDEIQYAKVPSPGASSA